MLGDTLFLEQSRRDAAGNDYPFDVIKVSGDASPETLGMELLRAVEVSSDPGKDRGDDRQLLWQQCMKKIGYRSWRQLFKHADHFFIFGKPGEFIKLSPSAKERGNFVGLDESLSVTVSWDPQAIGIALLKLVGERKIERQETEGV